MRLLFFAICSVFLITAAHAQPKPKAELRKKIAAGHEDTATVMACSDLAIAYVGINYDSAVYFINKAMQLGKQLNEPVSLARVYNSCALIRISMGEVELSKSLTDTAIAISTEAGDKKGLGTCYYNLGNYYRVANNLDSSIYYYTEGLKIKTALNDSAGMSSCYSSLGYCYHLQGDVKSALDYYYKAIPIREAIGDKKGLAGTYLYVAFIFIDSKEMQPALEATNKAHALFTELGITQSIANTCNAYGIIYMTETKYDSAMYWYNESLRLRTQLADSSGIAECYNNIGNIFNVQNNHDSAFSYYRRSIRLLHFATAQSQAQHLCNYASSAAHLGMIDSARWALSGVREIVNDDNRPDLRVSYYGVLGDFYETIGKYDSALFFTRSYYSLSDSIYRSESQKAFGELETKYQTTKKQKEIDDLTALQRQKDLQLMALVIGIGLLVLLVAYVIYVGIQRKKTNRLLAVQNAEIAEKNKDITDSINYAQRIQQSVLPDQQILFSNVSDAFIHYRPRDIVSGDFYWFRKEGHRLYIAAADCTGHGVPGALVSVVGVNILEQIIAADKTLSCGAVLDQLHRMMYTALHKDSSDAASDGMDIGLICIDSNKKTVEFSGASRPMLHWNGKHLQQVKGDRFSIGGVKDVNDTSSFTTQEIPLKTGDAFYLFTDGYADQFGGPEGKKFMSKNFVELIAANAEATMPVQQSKVDSAFRHWQGSQSQVDDVLVIGMRI